MFLRFAFILTAFLVMSGCAGLASSGKMSNNSSGEAVHYDMATLHRIERNFHVIDPSGVQIPLKDLHAGQRIRLVTSTSTPEEMKNGGSLETTEYAGTIGAIDSDNIVLRDASLVTNVTVIRGTPIVSRVPYISRMFSNTSHAKETHPLPHGVTIPRSKVIVALGESAEIVERIGVDFDHSVDSNKTDLRGEVALILRHQTDQKP